MKESMFLFSSRKYQDQIIAAVTTQDPGFLQWAAGTDIFQRYPGLALQSQVALMGEAASKSIPNAHDVEPDSARLTDLGAVNSEVAS